MWVDRQRALQIRGAFGVLASVVGRASGIPQEIGVLRIRIEGPQAGCVGLLETREELAAAAVLDQQGDVGGLELEGVLEDRQGLLRLPHLP